MELTRRNLVKTTAVALASAAAAGTMGGCSSSLAGTGDDAAATGGDTTKTVGVCRFCGCGCGVIVEAKDGKVIAANMWGKVKTVLQMLTVLFYYFAAALAGPADAMAVGLITQILCWLCGAATVLSGGIYLWQNRKLFMQAK